MFPGPFWPALAAWFAMLLVSMANGAARDLIYGKHLSELRAHQISSAISVCALGMVIWGFVSLFPPADLPAEFYVTD